MPKTAFALVATLLCSSVALAAPSALDTVKQKNAEVDKLLRQKLEKGSPAEQKTKDDLRRIAGSLLNYEEMAKRALGPNAEKFSAAQQKEFATTFQKLLERRYVKQLRTNVDYQIQWKGEEITGADAKVTSLIKVKTKSGSTDAELVYKLTKSPVGWQVWDIVTDGDSLLANYSSQFASIITNKGADELLRRLKVKADAPSEDSKTGAKDGE